MELQAATRAAMASRKLVTLQSISSLQSHAATKDYQTAEAQPNTPARLCCTNRFEDSLFESRVIAGRYEQLVPHKVQEHELVG
ncbi:hypothetical protein KMP13_01515, partial [Epibacterium ulvae]|uniref:hypothetical protein n=1 Tax=Epibacterium ulvae TaxID=1156985 RepID=UPI001BFCA921